MVVGISSFSGRRLIQARHLRRLHTITALADLSGISKQMVSRYEADTAKPTEERLNQLAKCLNLPVEFFLRPTGAGEERPIMFRSMRSALKHERERAEQILELAHEASYVVEEFVELPAVELPMINRAGRVRELTNEMIEEAAHATRASFGFVSGPLPNLVALVERSGVAVVRTELAERELDGLSRWDERRPIIVLNTTKSPARSRFDLAHEIGHLVLHSFIPSALLESRSLYDEIENQAHRFAGALLLPRAEFANDLWVFTLDEFVSLKQKWQVSAQAMARRSFELDLIGPDHYVRLQKQFSARKWRVEEPMEAVVRNETPSLIRQSIEVIHNEVPGGRDILATRLPFGNLLSEISSAPPAFLEEHARSKLVDIRSFRSA